MDTEPDSTPRGKGHCSAADAAASIVFMAPALEVVSPSAAALIRLVAQELRPVASADAQGLRIEIVEALRARVEAQSSKALDAYRHVIDANNSYERAAVVLGILNQAAALYSDAAVAIRFVRRNIPALVSDRYSDEKLRILLKALAGPSATQPTAPKRAGRRSPKERPLSFVKRVEACLPVLRVLGLCPNSRESGNEIATLRKKLSAVMKERRAAFGLPADQEHSTAQRRARSGHSRVTTSRSRVREKAGHGSSSPSHPRTVATAGQAARARRGGSPNRSQR